MKPLLPRAVEDYLQQVHAEAHPVLREMEAEGARRNFPIIGPTVGRLCAQWTRALDAKRIFEMGSGFGYSTAHFARAAGPTGKVVHTDGSPDLSAEAKAWLTQANLADRVDFRIGDACDLLARDPATYDIVFIDIDKEDYPEAWRIASGKVRVGGAILTDNTLWSGKVADPTATDPATTGARDYNRLAFSHERFLSHLVPIRDGVTVSLRVA